MVTIFNIVILHGEALFPDEHSHYEVFYEILRNQELFNNLNTIGSFPISTSQYFLSFPDIYLFFSHSETAMSNSAGGDVGTSKAVVSLNLVNIQIAAAHFQFKIEAWTQLNGYSTISPEQVYTLIHQNLGTLELKKLEKLELYERYSEHPQQMNFFRGFLRGVVGDCRSLLEEKEKEVADPVAQA